MRLAIVLGLLLIVACAQTTTPPTQDEPQTPEVTEEIPVEEVPDPQIEENVTESIEEPSAHEEIVEEWSAPKNILSSLTCERDRKRVSFTLTNTGDEPWEVGTTPPFPAPQDKTFVQVYVNGQDVFKSNAFNARKCLEGPLEPQKNIKCTASDLTLVTENAYSRNTIEAKGVGVRAQATLSC